MKEALDTPWKIWNEGYRWLLYPWIRWLFIINRIPWGQDWRFYGVPIIQKHKNSQMLFGSGLQLRSMARSNPLGPNRPVILTTWQSDSILNIGDRFGMTGGTICVVERIIIGNNVIIGANSTIADTDFHPIDPILRRLHPNLSKSSPITIEDDVFIGMNSIILKGVKIGKGSMVGAGSVVTRDVPTNTIVAGNPAKPIGSV